MTYAIMSDADYKGICDTVRSKTGTSALLKSAEVAPAIRSIELSTTSLTLTVTTEAGAVVTATKGSLSVTETASNGTTVLTLPEAGEWVVTASLNGETSTVVVSVSDSYELSLSYAVEVSYTGTYTDEIVAMSDGNYRLLTLTGSGTLTLSAPTECDIWMCGGGGGGCFTTATTYGGGGGGGYVKNLVSQVVQNLVVQVGAGGGDKTSGNATNITGDVSLSVDGGQSKSTTSDKTGGNGGSGGGGGYGNGRADEGGAGAGISTRPFLDAALPPYCGGGAGYGGAGGSDGGDGASTGSGTHAGGYLGGGAVAADATAYGGGGGGRSTASAVRGSGYQGCVMIRIPA